MQDSVQALRCLCVIDNVCVCTCVSVSMRDVMVCVWWRKRLISVWGVTGMAKGSDCRARSTGLEEEEEEEEEGNVAWEW